MDNVGGHEEHYKHSGLKNYSFHIHILVCGLVVWASA